MEDQVLPRSNLDAGIDAARLANPVINHQDGRTHVFVPVGYTLQDVTDPHFLPPRIGQAVTVDDRASFTAYANRFRDDRSVIIADYDSGHIRAHLDWHTDSGHDLKAQHNAHSVTHVLRDSEEFARWRAMEGSMHTQEEFALFIEENVADVVDPEQSVLIEVCRDLEAAQGVAFKSGTRLENGDRTFRYETETHVKSEVQVPTEITLSIPLYHGEEPTDIKAKFRFRPTPGGLQLGFVWHRVEYQRFATFRQMAHQAAEDTGLPVFMGRA